MNTSFSRNTVLAGAAIAAVGVGGYLLYRQSAKKSKMKRILGFGNPLLDISADVPQAFLDKYGVKLNDAILAEDKHKPIYADMEKEFSVDFTAGGATQNSLRMAQWVSQTKGTTAFVGCVGKDKYAEILEASASGDGVDVNYLVDEKVETGTCACLILDKERSLIANLAAANEYKVEHAKSDAIQKLINDADIFYIAGFFLTVSPETIFSVAEHSAANDKKIFAMNISAPFIAQFFADPFLKVFPLIDIIFGNESEAEAFAKKQGWEDTSAAAVAKKLATMPRKAGLKPRIAIITQGPDNVCVAIGDDSFTEFPVPKLDKDKIIDANGAGDAFVGGFLAKLAQGEDMKTCVNAGSKAAAIILQTSGVVMPKGKPDF